MKERKLLLLQPPIEDFYDTPIRLQPLGLAYLKAAVNKWLPEIEVGVRDFHAAAGKRTVPLPRELRYLSGYYSDIDQSPFSTFHRYSRYGSDPEQIAKQVAAEKPDWVGISALFTPYWRQVVECAEAIKRIHPVPIIVGGFHATAAPEQLLQTQVFDAVICGEGERPLVEWLRAEMAGKGWNDVPNLVWRHGDKLVQNSVQENYAIDELPLPDFSDLVRDRYAVDGQPLCFVLSSRGCPYRCAFCAVHCVFGDHYRPRSVQAVVAEIEQRYNEGYRLFDFEDDNLTFDRRRMLELCAALVERFPADEIEFLAMNGVSYRDLDAELLQAMWQAGFRRLNLALVSTDDGVRKALHRPHALPEYARIIDTAVQIGYRIISYQILGLPHESLESMIHTLAFNAALPVQLGASVFYLTPGMPLAAEFPLFTPERFTLARSSALAIETEAVRRDDLYTLFIITRMINFIKGLKLPEESLTLAEALQVARASGGREALGAELLQTLMQEGVLYAAHGRRRIPLPHFSHSLFQSVMGALTAVRTLSGAMVGIG
ncbi:B12-binding domain-containing radical SAM protein [candidate division KSB1 bacterium]|nr:B12-binding domain-containing radical SAM protein [candidate division KSB1 bacterium]